MTQSEIQKKLEGGDITPRDEVNFYAAVRALYTARVAYILKWFQLKEPVVKDSQFVNFFTKEECDFGMVATFVQRYPALLDFKDEDLDKLNEEFIDYQTLSREDIPTSVWDEASERVDAEGGGISWRMVTVWGYLRGLKLPGVQVRRFPMLSKVAQVVLTIPHSNVGEESFSPSFARSDEMTVGVCSLMELFLPWSLWKWIYLSHALSINHPRESWMMPSRRRHCTTSSTVTNRTR